MGNIAKDLGLEPQKLEEHGVGIASRGTTQLFTPNLQSGSLIFAGRVDWEELCMGLLKCQLNLEVLLEDKVKIYGVVVEVRDINSNVPYFREDELEIKLSENAATGLWFSLSHAWDLDIGKNCLQSYGLSSNTDIFLDVQSGADSNTYPELVLEHALDQEQKAIHYLVFIASGGGDPIRTGTVRIRVMVVDVNDNVPVFAQSEPHECSRECVTGTKLLCVSTTMEDHDEGANADDPDEGANAEVMYSFCYVDKKAAQVFKLDANLGTISTIGELNHKELRIQ